MHGPAHPLLLMATQVVPGGFVYNKLPDGGKNCGNLSDLTTCPTAFLFFTLTDIPEACNLTALMTRAGALFSPQMYMKWVVYRVSALSTAA